MTLLRGGNRDTRRGIGRRGFLKGAAGGLATAAGAGLLPGDLSAQGDPGILSLAEASRRLGDGSVTSVQLTRDCLRRIEQYDPQLNAFITVARERALARAAAMDAELARGGRRGPLHGVPIALKDNIDTADIRTTGASELFVERFPEEDAEVVRRLEEAGAVMLGKLNLHEFAYGGSSTVTHFGTIHNPWNLDHVTGGSSGGPGAAVAAGLCYGALGTDTAGSVRGPAAHCGIVGLKPTYGRVSTRGVITLSWSLDHVGPMCRTVEDCALMLNAIAGHDPREPTSTDRPVPDYSRSIGGTAAGYTLGIPRSPFYEDLHGEVESAVNAALAVLRGLTAGTREVALPPTGDPGLPSTLWDAEAYAWHEPWITTEPEKYQPGTRETLQEAADAPAWEHARARRELDLLRQSAGEAFERADLLVLPTMKTPPRRLDEENDRRGNNNIAFDVLGLPAISIPCGFTEAGLPMGLQIVGPHFAEADVLTLAHAYERATDWHERQPPLGQATPAA